MSDGREDGGTADWMSSYSDAVFAVIVTIMVLELRPPHSTKFSALFDLWPTAISYVVSYVFVAIIWINHHNLTRILCNPSLGLIWVNFVHLFLVSLPAVHHGVDRPDEAGVCSGDGLRRPICLYRRDLQRL